MPGNPIQEKLTEPPAMPPLCREYGVDNLYLEPQRPKQLEIDTSTPEGKERGKQLSESTKDLACMLKIKGLQERWSQPKPPPCNFQYNRPPPYDAELPL